MTRPIILAGMHRSGTSFLARFLFESGIHMGDDLLRPAKFNPHGHFEDVEVLEFQREVCGRSGHRMGLQLPLITAEDRARAASIATARRAQTRPWGWKEPRTTLFAELWLEMIPDAFFLFVYRTPELVLDSLARRHGFRPWSRGENDKYLAAWSLYNEEALRFHERHPEQSMIFGLQDALAAPDSFVQLLSRRAGHPFSTDAFSAALDTEILTTRKTPWRWISSGERRRAREVYAQLVRADDLRNFRASAV